MEISQTNKPFKKRSLSHYERPTSQPSSVKQRKSVNEEQLPSYDNKSLDKAFEINTNYNSKPVYDNSLDLELENNNDPSNIFFGTEPFTLETPQLTVPMKDASLQLSTSENKVKEDSVLPQFSENVDLLLDVLASNNIPAANAPENPAQNIDTVCEETKKTVDVTNNLCTPIKKSFDIIDLTSSNSPGDVIDLTCDDSDIQVQLEIKRVSIQPFKANFILKHLKTIDYFAKLPKQVTLKSVSNGLEISGPGGSVGIAQKLLSDTRWLYNETITIDCPKGFTHFNKDCWKDFAKVLEDESRCAILVEYITDGSSTLQTNDNNISNTFRTTQHSSGITIDLIDGNNQPQSNLICPSESSHPNPLVSVKYNDLNVIVCQGDIADDDSHAIVNGVSAGFNLTSSAISQSILRKGGQTIATECSISPHFDFPLDIRVTNGYSLRCKLIFHLITPVNIDEYTSKILSVLKVANEYGVDSLAIPTLGTGGNNLDPVMASQCMAKAFDEFSKAAAAGSLKTIKVVVFNASLYPIFLSNIITAKEHLDFSCKQVMNLEKKVKSIMNSNKVDVHFASDRQEFLIKAKERIERHLETYISRRTVDNEMVVKLGDHDCIDIYEASIKHQVHIQYIEDDFKRFQEIALVGLKDSVNSLYEYMRELWFELREAEILTKTVVWKWEIGRNHFVPFPIRVSAVLERLYELNSFEKYEVRLHGKVLKVFLGLMTYEFEDFKGKILRVPTSKDLSELPNEWAPMNDASLLRVCVDPSTTEYNEVVKLFILSRPQFQKICKIERIQNPSLYRQYALNRDHVAKHLISNNPVERLLFHGTSEEDVKKICSRGFDRGFAGKNATAYGKGCYFAINSSYSIGYTRKGHSNFRHMFMAHVITGDYTQGQHQLRAPPEKLVSTGGQSLLYDSVVDNLMNPKMFVVFKDSSAYPSYLITFL